MKKALIVGCTGQDGSYLAEQLLGHGYEVHGTKRRSSSLNTSRLDHLYDNPAFSLHYADVTAPTRLFELFRAVQPDEVYNLAAQSHVGLSFELPTETAMSAGIGALNVLEAVRLCCPKARVYQASSSEMFGNSPGPQSETTPFAPRSPYGCAKLFAHHAAINYREAHGLWISCGILFNHESPRRGETFVTRKITRGLNRIRARLQDKLVLGNMEARRDWGYAPEYTDAMWRMLQTDAPGDYVIGTGKSASVSEFLDHCLLRCGLPSSVVEVESNRYRRATDICDLRAGRVRALKNLGWQATSDWKRVADLMLDADMQEAARCVR